jgi:hypothetical protein
MVRDGIFWIEETDTSFSKRFVLPNQSMFHILYFTIVVFVESVFALDGNSYITKWLIGMYLKNIPGEIRCFERSSFVGKLVLRREVCLLLPDEGPLLETSNFPCILQIVPFLSIGRRMSIQKMLRKRIPLHPSCNYVIFTWINR